MDQILQALVMGIAQGLTEFLPISSSGHLILIPYVFGWSDSFIESLAFSVVLHGGTLLALLVYFREDWLRLIPAFFASLRDRSIGDDADRRLIWLLVLSTLPAAVIALFLNDIVEQNVRHPGLVAVMLVIAGAVLWLADRWGARTRPIGGLTARGAVGIGFAQALALIPGVSRSGISISAGLFAGLDRAAAARYSFLMATPITAMAVAYESLKLIRGEVGGVEPRDPGRGRRRVVRVRRARDLRAAALRADAVVQHLRRLPPGARCRRPRRVPGPVASRRHGMEVMKQLRQRAIRDLVEQRPIRTQQELAAALRERGFRTTQATISRDVAELGLVKAGRNGMQAYAIPPRLREADTSGEERIRRLLHEMPVEIREAGTILVLKTLPGSAHPLAAALDRARWPEVAGSIAAMTRCSSRSPIGGRWAACADAWSSSERSRASTLHPASCL